MQIKSIVNLFVNPINPVPKVKVTYKQLISKQKKKLTNK